MEVGSDSVPAPNSFPLVSGEAEPSLMLVGDPWVSEP